MRFIFDGAPALRSAALAGTFNSWVGDACMLERVTPTRWTCTVPLPTGRHLYKFVLDGTHWIADPANPWLAEDHLAACDLTYEAARARCCAARRTWRRSPCCWRWMACGTS